MTLERLEVTPGIPEVAVRRVLEKDLDLWTACGIIALPEGSEPDGRISLSFRIGETGKIVERRSYEPSLTARGPLPESCLNAIAAEWTFPRRQWGQDVDVTALVRWNLTTQLIDEQRRAFAAEMKHWCEAYRRATAKKDANATAAATKAVLDAHVGKVPARGSAATALALLKKSTLSLPGRVIFVGGLLDLEDAQRVAEAAGLRDFCPSAKQ